MPTTHWTTLDLEDHPQAVAELPDGDRSALRSRRVDVIERLTRGRSWRLTEKGRRR